MGLGIRKVRITGGEPLVRRGIVDFVARLASQSGVEDLSLTTNGLLLGAMAAELRAAGLRRVNVSLDTLRPEVFRNVTRRPGLDKVLAGLEAARRVGLDPVKINVVAMRGVNDGELGDFVAFAEQGGYEVRFIEFMPSGHGAWDAAGVLSCVEILETLRERYDLQPLEGEAGCGPSRMFASRGGGRVGVISPLSDHFCGTCNRLRLTAEGRLRSCLFSADELDLRALLRSGAGDEELAGAIRAVVQGKPERHALSERGGASGGLAMSRVGG